MALPQVVGAQDSKKGVIEGSLGYPSEFIPADMVICAQNLATGKLSCTGKHIKHKKYTYRVGYRLVVLSGDYYIYAYLPDPQKFGADFSKDYKAYYSEFVKCGMRAECPSHAPIKVTVVSGKTVTGIDPQDWYNFK